MLGPVVLLTGAVSHSAADGLLPGPAALGALLLACTALSAAFLRTRASAVRLVSLLVGGQALTHLVLSVGAGHHGTTVDHLVEHTLAQGPLMLLAHTLGAVALGLWLALGEAALWRLLLLGAARVRVAVALHSLLTPARASLLGALDASRRLAVPRPVLLPLGRTLPHRLVTRRGPPVLLAA